MPATLSDPSPVRTSTTPASRAPWLALCLILAALLIANRRPIADAVAGPMASLLGGRAGGRAGSRLDAWPIVPAPGPLVILGPAVPAGATVGCGGQWAGGRRAGGEGEDWGPGEVGD